MGSLSPSYDKFLSSAGDDFPTSHYRRTSQNLYCSNLFRDMHCYTKMLISNSHAGFVWVSSLQVMISSRVVRAMSFLR